jgi:hypothetical protein
LDSGNPSLAIKQLGGTGRVHDWRLSRRIVEQSPVPVFLAGGLHANNVREAIGQVRPFGVDLCNGVRTDGHLDPKKLKEFFNAVKKQICPLKFSCCDSSVLNFNEEFTSTGILLFPPFSAPSPRSGC